MGVTYYATQTTFPCESTDRLAVTVTLDILASSGTDTTAPLCDDISGDLDLISLLNGSPSSGGTWSGDLATTNGDRGTIDTNQLDLATGTYVFTYTQAEQNLCSGSSSTLTLELFEAPNPGTDATLDICTNDARVDLFTLLGNDADTGGTWSPSLASGTGFFDPAVDSGGVYTYTLIGTAPCDKPFTASVTVNLTQVPDAGINGSLVICDESTADVNLFNLLGGSPDGGGVWTGPVTLTNGDLGTLDTELLSLGSYTFNYIVNSTNECTDDSSRVVVVVTADPDAGDDAEITLCENATAVDLFTLLGSDAQVGGTWSPALASFTGVFDPAVDTAGVYTYRVNAAPPCTNDATAQVTVIIENQQNAGVDNTVTLCSSDAAIDLFASLGPTADLSGTWSPALNSGTGIFDPAIDAAGDYTYTIAATDNCAEDTAVITVTVEQQNNPGTNGTADLCTNEAAVDLINFLNDTPDVGGVWSPALVSGTGIFDPAIDTAGTYTYTFAATTFCPEVSAEVEVGLTAPPNAGVAATITICGNDSPTDLFPLLGPSADAGGVWSGPSTLSNADLGTFNPNVNTSGDYQYTVTGSGSCTDVVSTVSVTLVNPIPTLNTDGNIFCGG